MIVLVNKIPNFDALSASWVKIKCLYEAYQNDDRVLFWIADNAKAIISLTDGNMVIYNIGADLEELKEFVAVINPACIFSDYETLCSIGRIPQEKINIVYRKADIIGETESDCVTSKEVYNLLDVEGLSLPEYPYFAVDYCHRLNKSLAECFAIKNKCCAVSFNCGNYAIMNGIASRQKGMGSLALKGILQKNQGRYFLVCCRDSVLKFYEKNGFSHIGFGGYWVKNNVRK